MSFTLAIIGRPNVGKSTLFNRLVGQRLALVDDQPGVTRDLREGQARLGPLRFQVVDSAGLEEAQDDSLQGRMRKLTEQAIAMADACLFLIDARAGITRLDEELAQMLRKSAKHVILGANKSESRASEAGVLEAFSLGLGDPLCISAEHGEGMEDLYTVLAPLVEAHAAIPLDTAPLVDVAVETLEEEDHGDDPLANLIQEGRSLQIAVMGRPNAGKSTLVNTLLGHERMLTGPEAGITRDAIAVQFQWDDVPVRIFDTAGMRKKAKVQEKLEKLSVADGLRAVRFAEVVVLLLDAQIPFEQQDLRMADLAEREGRAVVIAVNKWDIEDEKQAKLAHLKEACTRLLPQLRGVPLVTLSAKTGKGIDRLKGAIFRAYRTWNARIPTAQLNRWLEEMVVAHPPPAPGGRRIKLRYATQAKTRPPGFVVMCSQAEHLPASYARYLVNGLRQDFGLDGTPIRLNFRDRKEQNPYKDRKNKKQSSRLKKHLK